MDAPNPFAPEPPGEADDRQLVTAARAGDRNALERLVERHQRWIYNTSAG